MYFLEQKILGDIRDQLETTEDSEIMIAIVDAFVITSQWKPKIFESHFQVHLIFGMRKWGK